MKQQYHVLCVEDDVHMLIGIRDILEFIGDYTCSTAQNGIEALAILRDGNEQIPDVIISDIMMPHMNGFALLEEVRKDSRFLEIPFIFLTAIGEAVDRRNKTTMGADIYLTKPFESEDLLTAIESALKGEKPLQLLQDIREEKVFKKSQSKKPQTIRDTKTIAEKVVAYFKMLRGNNEVARGTAIINIAKLRRNRPHNSHDTPAQDAFWRNVYHSLQGYADEQQAIEKWKKMAELAKAFLLKETAQNTLLCKLAEKENEDSEVVASALRALGLNEYQGAMPILIKQAKNSDHKDIRSAAVYSLGLLKQEDTIPLLKDAIEDTFPAIRLLAINALVAIGSENAVMVLKDNLQHEDRTVRIDIIKALPKLNAETALQIFEQVLEHEVDMDVLCISLETLVQIDNPKSTQLINKMANHESEQVRKCISDIKSS